MEIIIGNIKINNLLNDSKYNSLNIFKEVEIPMIECR